MAAVSIAFEAPENVTGYRAAPSRPIDLVHLAGQTMGDKALEIEVLQTFARHARASLQEIAHGDRAGAAIAIHRLKGAAAAVGAFQVSAAAEKLEASPTDAALFAGVDAAVLEAENFILKLCR
ncbi:MAG: Hpt domain-containing protein [Rhizobiales bacterium 63-7]|nr:Hpt domain-containing protein [Hyphomicrobiales bacterium]OJU66427.1 MAG: Hpt domain-containing protein [Rhizobiales bacterium 63-7]